MNKWYPAFVIFYIFFFFIKVLYEMSIYGDWSFDKISHKAEYNVNCNARQAVVLVTMSLTVHQQALLTSFWPQGKLTKNPVAFAFDSDLSDPFWSSIVHFGLLLNFVFEYNPMNNYY